jgi:galactosamine-6-phosphate isomerase
MLTTAMGRNPITAPLGLRIAPDAATMSRRAADLIVERVRAKPDLLLCTATGATPTLTYELFVQAAAREPSLASRLRIIKLDEWGGLSGDDPATCEAYLQEKLIRPLRIPPGRYTSWHTDPPDPQAECGRIEAWLAGHGPIDLCVLGLGINGHIGFNEPAEALQPGPHVAQLAAESMQHPMLLRSPARPRYGLTLGIGDICRSGEGRSCCWSTAATRQVHWPGCVRPKGSPAAFRLRS